MKAFQVKRNYPDVIAEEAEFSSLGIIDLIEELGTLSGRAKIKSKIADLMTNALKGSGEEIHDSEDVNSRISISVSGPTPGGPRIGRAFIIPESGKPIKFSKYIVNRTTWANSYMSDQPMAYFFTEDIFTDLLFVSLELILRTDYGAVLPPSGMAACKRKSERISAKKNYENSVSTRGFPTIFVLFLSDSPELIFRRACLILKLRCPFMKCLKQVTPIFLPK